MDSPYVWVLDNGHGGMLGVEYQTAGKRSPVLKAGVGVYEGAFNRDMVKRVLAHCQRAQVYAIDLVPEAVNVSLTERLRRLRHIVQLWGQVAFISIHANAAGDGKGWHPAEGQRVFIRPKANDRENYIESLRLAEVARDELQIKPEVKTKNFAVLKGGCPSILYEAAFMTNKEGARKLASESFRAKKSLQIFETILSFGGCEHARHYYNQYK